MSLIADSMHCIINISSITKSYEELGKNPYSYHFSNPLGIFCNNMHTTASASIWLIISTKFVSRNE
jgi:hypothetical protein